MRPAQSMLRLLVIALALCLATARAQSLRFTVTSDARGYAGHADVLAAVDSVAGGPGEFIVTPGDMDPLPTTRAQIDAAFGVSFPWYPVIGNHEQEHASDVEYLRDFYWENLDGFVNPGPDGTTEMTYSFDAGPAHIVVLNVYWDGTTDPDADIARDGDVVPALRDWTEADLAASAQPWKLVFLHEPAYPQADQQWGDARHAGDSLDQYPANRDAFWQMLEDHGAAACFVAHTHRYSSCRWPGSPVWQIDAAQARGTDEYDTFLVVDADHAHIRVDVYRSLYSGGFVLLETLDLADRPESELLTFQQGVEGYSDTVDTLLHGAFPDTDYSTATELAVDGADSGQEIHALIRFGSVIGEQPGQIPPGARILSAALKFYTTNPTSGEVNFHRMLTPWEDTDTWNSLAGGISADGSEAASNSDGVLPGDSYSGTWHPVDVTASLRAWAEYGDGNQGWALLPTGTNGWDCYSSEGTYAPQLVVEYDARPLQFVRFQQGVDGYAGNVDTKLRGASPDESYAGYTVLNVDSDEEGYETQALIRFEQITGAGAGQIPGEARIIAAKLRLYTDNPTDNNAIMFHRMLGDWDDTDTWNSMVDGISADDIEAAAVADAQLAPDKRASWWHEVDVTASVRAWVAGGAANFGWALLPTGDNSWQFRSAEGTPPPQLVVWYLIVGDVDGDGDVDLFDLEALLPVYGTCAGDPAYDPDADFDGSGCIELSDLADLLGNYGYGT